MTGMNKKNKNNKEESSALITVLKMTDNPDGSADMEFEYNHEFKRLVQEHYKIKDLRKVTKKLISDFVLQALKDAAERVIKEGNAQ
jgi:hypothetical protein